MPSSLPSQTGVLVVGAGPTGLLLAGERRIQIHADGERLGDLDLGA